MDILLNTFLGELASRSMRLLINRFSKPGALAVVVSLDRILLRAQVIVEEAASRCITNQAMLKQLSMLRDAMYEGHYMLDTFRYQDHQAVSHSWAPTKFSYAKHLCFSSNSNIRCRNTLQELEKVLDSLRTMILDMSELVVLLSTYPRLQRQPCSMHLLLDKCMFGRQMEMERVIYFLLHRQPFSSRLERFDILPIYGAGKVRKSTLVSHVCSDERVRDHFSQIVLFRHHNFSDEKLAALRGCALNGSGRLLLIVEVDGDLNQDWWERLCSLSEWRTASGSKIIITSRSDKITKLGTTQALALKRLSDEAYWYFFKVNTFGSTGPEMHPRLAYLAMEIAREMNGCILNANMVASLLRDNFNIHFWSNVLASLRVYKEENLYIVGDHPGDMFATTKSTYTQRLARISEDICVLDPYHPSFCQQDVPKITFQDVADGRIMPSSGTFKVLAWKSPIPPYHCYIFTCQIQELQTRPVKRKRSLNYNGMTHG